MTLYYLAHPYSNNPAKNMESVNTIAAHLFHQGITFYSPLSMTHPIHRKGLELKLYEGERWEDWIKFDEAMMEKCDALILCPGWQASAGCMREFTHFSVHKKEIRYIELDGNLIKWYTVGKDGEIPGFTECIICKKMFLDSLTKNRNVSNLMDYCPACYEEKINSWE